MKRLALSFLILSLLSWLVSCGPQAGSSSSSKSSTASSVASSQASSVASSAASSVASSQASSVASSAASSVTSSAASSLPAGIRQITIYVSAPDTGDNVVYIAGDLSNLSTTTNMQNKLASWDPTSPKGEMTKDGSLWKIYLYTDATNDASYQFKFVNGTSGYGGTWANEEMEYRANGTTKEAIDNRVLDVLATEQYTVLYATNDVTNTDGKDVNVNSKIVVWKGTGPTYPCSNVTFYITHTPVITNSPVNVAAGDYVQLYGSFNGWNPAVVSNTVNANDSVTFTFQYTGAAAVDWQLRKAGFNGSYDTGNNFSYVIPLSQANGGTVYITNSGSWRAW